MSSSRRDFLRSIVGASTVATLASHVPGFLRQTALASGNVRTDHTLIVVQLSGGNDGLNTVVPYDDDAYGRNRRTLRLTGKQVHKIDSELGFHPQMRGFLDLFEKRELAIVQGVGYPKSNRDHEAAMRDWYTAEPENATCPTGWIGRVVDKVDVSGGVQVPAVMVSSIGRPLVLTARDGVVPSIRVAKDLTLQGPALSGAKAVWSWSGLAEQGRGGRGAVDDNPLLQQVRNSGKEAAALSDRVRNVLARDAGRAEYPSFTLAGHFQTIAQLIRANIGIRIFFTELGGGGFGGFDNHASQRDNHAALLRDLSASMAALAADLRSDGTLDRVLLMTFSEFGRTLSENGRRGTGHGAAAPVFLLGGRLKGGLIGRHPSLTDLDRDAPKHHTDFRQLYATVLDQWLQVDSTAILGRSFKPLNVLA